MRVDSDSQGHELFGILYWQLYSIMLPTYCVQGKFLDTGDQWFDVKTWWSEVETDKNRTTV